MRTIKYLRHAAAWLALAGVHFPASALAAPPVTSSRGAPTATTSQSAIVDVELQAGGQLTGRVVGQDGHSVASAKVTIRQGNVELGETLSAADGSFRINSVKGGVYSITAANDTYLCRAWEVGVAPPSAGNGMLLVDHSQTVLRGQMMANGCGGQCDQGCAQQCAPTCGPQCAPACDPCGKRCSPFGFLANPWVIGAAVAVAIAVPLALDDDDDAS